MGITRHDPGARFCRAVTYNGVVYLAGMTANDTTGDTAAQTKDILAKIDGYLKMAGTDKSKLLSATIWLRDIADFDRMNGAWMRGSTRRTCPYAQQ